MQFTQPSPSSAEGKSSVPQKWWVEENALFACLQHYQLHHEKMVERRRNVVSKSCHSESQDFLFDDRVTFCSCLRNVLSDRVCIRNRRVCETCSHSIWQTVGAGGEATKKKPLTWFTFRYAMKEESGADCDFLKQWVERLKIDQGTYLHPRIRTLSYPETIPLWRKALRREFNMDDKAVHKLVEIKRSKLHGLGVFARVRLRPQQRLPLGQRGVFRLKCNQHLFAANRLRDKISYLFEVPAADGVPFAVLDPMDESTGDLIPDDDHFAARVNRPPPGGKPNVAFVEFWMQVLDEPIDPGEELLTSYGTAVTDIDPAVVVTPSLPLAPPQSPPSSSSYSGASSPSS